MGQPRGTLEAEPQPGSPWVRGPSQLHCLYPSFIVLGFVAHTGGCADPWPPRAVPVPRAGKAQEEPCPQDVGEGPRSRKPAAPPGPAPLPRWVPQPPLTITKPGQPMSVSVPKGVSGCVKRGLWGCVLMEGACVRVYLCPCLASWVCTRSRVSFCLQVSGGLSAFAVGKYWHVGLLIRVWGVYVRRV